jgi:16S rRNA (guanine527-N7)-methyltransferase
MALKWSRAMSLTSLRSADEAIDRHVVESVAAALAIDRTAESGLDVGSGNGYPAIPIKILNPGIRLILLEPHLRRSVFLEQVIRQVGLSGAEVRRTRIDGAGDLRVYSRLSLISMRGVARTQVILEGSASALAPRGQVVLLLGERRGNEVLGSLPPGLELEIERVLPCRGRTRLIVLRKTAPV